MKIELDRTGLQILVNGSQPHYNEFENPLLRKAGHNYSDQYGRTSGKGFNFNHNYLFNYIVVL